MFSEARFTGALAAMLTISVLLAGAGGALAQSDDPSASELFRQFSEMSDTFNEQIVEVDLGPAGDRLAGQTANVVIDTPDGQERFSFSMDEENRITNLQPTTVDDADLVVRTDAATVESIATSDTPAQAFRDAYRDGDITIKANYGLVEAATSGRIVDWGFWTAADLFKGLL